MRPSSAWSFLASGSCCAGHCVNLARPLVCVCEELRSTTSGMSQFSRLHTAFYRSQQCTPSCQGGGHNGMPRAALQWSWPTRLSLLRRSLRRVRCRAELNYNGTKRNCFFIRKTPLLFFYVERLSASFLCVRRVEKMTAEKLKTLLKAAKQKQMQLQLVIISACYSRKIAQVRFRVATWHGRSCEHILTIASNLPQLSTLRPSSMQGYHTSSVLKSTPDCTMLTQ